MADTWHPIEAVCTKQKKVIEQILRKWLNSLKICIFLLFCTTNRAQKDPFEYFNGVQLFTADRWYHTEAVCTKRKKVIKQFLRKWLKSLKICIFLLFLRTNRAQKDPFEYFNGDQLFMADRWYHTEAVCIKRKKVTEQFQRKWAKCVKSSIFLPMGGSQSGLGGPSLSISMRSSPWWLIHDI